MTLRPTLLAAVAMLAASRPAAAQAPAPTPLGKPEREYTQTFSNIGFIRELRDRRVVVIDSRERALVIIDTAGRQTPVGRSGSGPGEYLAPLGLYELPGDSTLVYDILNQRILLLDARGRPTGTDRITAIVRGVEQSLRQMAPTFGDREGRLYARGYPTTAPQAGEDSGAIVRYDRRTRRADTLGYLRVPAPVAVTLISGDGSTSNTRGVHPFAMRDGWAAGHDGRVAIVHASPYRVEWIRADGSRVTGPVIPYDRVPVSAADKAFIEAPENQKRIGGTGPGSAGLPERSPAPHFSWWPEAKPPFRVDSPVMAPDGRVWVERSRALNDSVRTYDIFDERGVLAERVALRRGRKLVGFGDGAVYLVRTDSDDLEHLERYARRFAPKTRELP